MGKGFNRDLDRYLSSRRESRRNFFSRSPKAEQVPEVSEHEVTVEDRMPSLWTRIFKKQKVIPSEDLTPQEQAKLEAMEGEIEAVDAAERYATSEEELDMLEEAKGNMFTQFIEKLRFFQDRHKLNDEAEIIEDVEEELKQERVEMEEDVKEVLKISHRWLGKLSKRHRDEFKDSKDFTLYCDILERYGVAKKK